MPHLIDTHTHLYVEQFDKDRDEVLKRASEAGVDRFFLPNIDSRYVERLLSMSTNYPEQCFPMMGLHPCSVDTSVDDELAAVKEWLFKRQQETPHKRFFAVGEIGIDLYWEKKYLKQQQYAFRKQIAWAKKLDMPIVIHCRNAFDEILEILEEEHDEKLRGIFHCFTGNPEQAERVLALEGFYLGIGGIVTFKNAGLDKTVATLPPERLVLETDAPYLAPHPRRGKRNESAFLRYIAEKVAEVKQLRVEAIVQQTTANAQKVYGLTKNNPV